MKTVVDLVTSLKTYFLGKDADAKQAVEANIAPVETDATSASKGYAVGKQLILNDVLYDVTAAITAGDPLTVGTNIAAADDVTAQIDDAETAIAGKASKDAIDTEYEAIGSAALYPHAAGTRFYATDGKVYKATADIAVSDTLTVGTNCSIDSIITGLNEKDDVPTVLTQTLASGATSVTFTGIPTTGDHIVDFYASNGANYKAIDVSTAGTAILTYEAPSSAVTVYCVIRGV